MELNCWKFNECKELNCETCVWYSHIMYFCEQAQIPINRYYTPKLKTVNSPDFDRYNNIKSNIVQFINEHNNLLINVASTNNDLIEYGIKLLLNYFSQISYDTMYGTMGLFVDIPQYIDKLKDNIVLKNENITQFKQTIDSVGVVVINNLISLTTPFIYDALYRNISCRANNKLSTIIVKNAETELNAQTQDLITMLKPVILNI